MTTEQANENLTFLKDYKQPDYWVKHVDLEFDLREGETFVTAKLQVERNGEHARPLVLDGKEMELLKVSLDGMELSEQGYNVDKETLTVDVADDKFVLETKVRLDDPKKNKSFEGLYRSSGKWCTQCEPLGFRKITYFVDRPDNMATFTTTVIGDEADADAPVLLSNGNQVEEGKTVDGRHFKTFNDPEPKPSYLFALVAGDLEYQEDTFETMSGREVTLRIYTDGKDQDKVDFAMDSLKRAMKWDEEVYGREYHLDIFSIMAVDDFNMGAMENTSLNVFNTSCVLAHPDVSTDADYQRIDAIIAHEYFHNWTGNLVTCRDWFQLCLKEGLTVFRDQEYSKDQYSAGVCRIDEARGLRAGQFPEDSGPMAHPPRPDRFETINNFYTATVYPKGAELNRMIRSIVGGAEEFRKGSDLYFDRYKGQAVTVEDWVKCHEDASGVDLSQFMLWYTQAGTPRVNAEWDYDASSQKFTLTLSQEPPVINGKKTEVMPRHIPVRFGLVDENGNDLVDEVLELTDEEQVFEFDNVPPNCVPSILRNFSAPVILNAQYSDNELRFLMVNDNDGFNQWEADNVLVTNKMLEQIDNFESGKEVVVDPNIIGAFEGILKNEDMDPELKSLALTLPSFAALSVKREEAGKPIDPQAIIAVRDKFVHEIATSLQGEFKAVYDASYVQGREYDLKDVGVRAIQNKALSYLSKSGAEGVEDVLYAQYKNANNITDRYAAFTLLMDVDTPEANALKDKVSDDFYVRAKATQDLVVNKWVSARATMRVNDFATHLEALASHESCQDADNPNRIRSFYGAFMGGNPEAFHAEDGSGYKFVVDFLMDLDKSNPQVASRMVDGLGGYKKLKPALGQKMREQLVRLASMDEVSTDVGEKLGRFLGAEEYAAIRAKKNDGLNSHNPSAPIVG